ncbi:hypothetical protein J1N35_025558, partial [Gossypium stocksii]
DKLREAQSECDQYKENVNHLENEKSILEEKLRDQKECHKAKLERLRQSHKEIFKKF